MKDSRGHVYVCEFSNGLIKIGRSSRNPSGRIKEHAKRMSCTGSKLERKYISPVISSHEMVEDDLIGIISGHLSSDSKEWCKNDEISFDSILSEIDDTVSSLKVDRHWYDLFCSS